MKTYVAKPQTVQRDWCVVDATDKTLGRLASELAHRLRGKHKPEYTPHVDTGDNIIVVNAEKIRVTGNKLKSINLEKQLAEHPERVIQSAVKGMLPRNPLGRAMFKKLHVYAGPEHPHAAQQPKELDI